MATRDQTDDMLDAISDRISECLTKANASAQKAGESEDLSERGRLSSESERWRHAAHELRMALNECQQICDDAPERTA